MDNFKTAEDAARFWKEKANGYKSELDSLRRDFSEFEEDSKSLENELELELQQNIVKNKDLNACVIKLMNENDLLKNRLDTQNQTELRQHADTMQEISAFKKQVDDLKRHVRQLEQKNDDLEKAYRAAQASIDDFETQLNGVIEKNVILESELDEKEHLKVLLQRMKDETRDQRAELNMKSQDSNRTTSDAQVPLPPRPVAVRTTPLSIVNDLLRKMGALETKLATYHRKEEQPSKRKVFPASFEPEPRVCFTATEAKDMDVRRGTLCCFSGNN